MKKYIVTLETVLETGLSTMNVVSFGMNIHSAISSIESQFPELVIIAVKLDTIDENWVDGTNILIKTIA